MNTPVQALDPKVIEVLSNVTPATSSCQAELPPIAFAF